MRHYARIAWLAGIVAVAGLAGCRSASPPTTQPQMNPTTREVAFAPAGLPELIAKLPGRTEADHLQLMSQVLRRFDDELDRFSGVTSAGRFALQRRTIVRVAETLRDEAVAGGEPMLDEAMGSVVNALADVVAARMADHQTLGPLVEKARAAVDELPFSRGALHRVATMQAVIASDRLLTAMIVAWNANRED